MQHTSQTLKDRWNELAYNRRREQDSDADFADLVNFFAEEDKILIRDPCFLEMLLTVSWTKEKGQIIERKKRKKKKKENSDIK